MKIFSMFVLLFAVLACSKTNDNKIVIGKITNDKYVITTDIETLQKFFDNESINKGAVLNNFSINKDYIEGTDDEAYYFLKGNNASNTVKVATEVLLENGNFYVSK